MQPCAGAALSAAAQDMDRVSLQERSYLSGLEGPVAAFVYVLLVLQCM